MERPPLDHANANGVVVAVEAAAANFADSLMIKGTYQERPNFPFTPGIEVAGTVTPADVDPISAIGLHVNAQTAWFALDRLDDVASGASTGKTVLVPDTRNLKQLMHQHRQGASL